MRILVFLLLGLAAVSAAPKNGQRIVGGTQTTINQYPMMASLLFSVWSGYVQACGGTVINNRAILTAAHCTIGDAPVQWRTRLGSTNANSGGTVYFTQAIINHPQYNSFTLNNDVSIIHTNTLIQFSNVVQPGSIAGSNYILPDNQAVWATGWGTLTQGGQSAEQLRHVQIYSINQQICAQRYATAGATITNQMLCSGVLDVGGRDQCQGDSGGPLFHNGVVVGVCSWGFGCASPFYPGVNARVSSFTTWIAQNA